MISLSLGVFKFLLFPLLPTYSQHVCAQLSWKICLYILTELICIFLYKKSIYLSVSYICEKMISLLNFPFCLNQYLHMYNIHTLYINCS